MLYQQVKNAMKNQNNNPKCRGIGELILLDYLEEKPSFDRKI